MAELHPYRRNRCESLTAQIEDPVVTADKLKGVIGVREDMLAHEKKNSKLRRNNEDKLYAEFTTIEMTFKVNT